MHRQLQLVVLLILIVECASFLPFAQQACLSPGVVMNAKKGNAMREYKEGDPLSGSEYLLKVYGKKGLLSTLTMQGTIPQTLKKWYRNHDLPIYVIEEKYREGWKGADGRLWAVDTAYRRAGSCWSTRLTSQWKLNSLTWCPSCRRHK